MNAIVTVLFGVLWLVLAFMGLRWLAMRYFHEAGRDVVAVIAVLLAFLIGCAWPFSSLRGIRGSSTATVPAGSAVVAAPGHEVGPACKGAHTTSTSGRGNIDGVGDMRAGAPEGRPSDFVASRSETLAVVGWAASATEATPATAVCLAIDGQIDALATGTYGFARPDVGAAFKNDAMIPTGFTLTRPIAGMRPGRHRVGVIVLAPTGNGQILSSATFRVP